MVENSQKNYKELSEKDKRIRKITSLYYSRKDIQEAIFRFSKNREVAPSYMMRSFGKRPDSFQYVGDIFGLVKRGATSFHCSEELWQDPLKISTNLNRKQFDELREGWDLLLDIDSKYFDYSKVLAKIIIKILKFYGVKNVGIKFSGSKGFHIVVPWKSFPKEVNGVKTSDMFPEWPRVITQFIMSVSRRDLIEGINKINLKEEYGGIGKYIRRESSTSIDLSTENRQTIGVRKKWDKFSKALEDKKYESDYLGEVVPDLVLVSPRHLFRMPYSLHEKTSLASVVIKPKDIQDFQPKDANPLKAKVFDFIPKSEEGEAAKLLREALDWYKSKNPEESIELTEKPKFKSVKIENFSESFIPPSIKKILQGVQDGRKRSLFILLNFFRSVGIDKNELEKKIKEWNKKNEVPLKEGYIKSQLVWSYRNKIAPPPNFDKDYYKGIGINPTEEEIRYKNPVNYVLRKSLQENSKKKPKNKKRSKSKDNFKNKS